MRRAFVAAVGASVIVALAAPVLAQNRSTSSAQAYPARPIRLIAPFTPGGGVDITARIFADGLGKALGQTVIVDNRPGAGSTLGTDIAAKASPDGYTLLLSSIATAFNVALYRKLPYDVVRDFAPISLLTEQPNILVAHPSLPAANLKEFIALARAQPDKLTYGTAGIGTGTHLAMELLAMSQGISLVHVPFRGIGPAITALLSNQISVSFSTYATALPHVKSERLRAYAVTSARRTATLPDVPTVAEQGVEGYEYMTWYGVFAPAGVTQPVLAKLSAATITVLKSPETRERYAAQGMDAIPCTPAEFARHLTSEIAKWTKVVRAAKIPLQ